MESEPTLYGTFTKSKILHAYTLSVAIMPTPHTPQIVNEYIGATEPVFPSHLDLQHSHADPLPFPGGASGHRGEAWLRMSRPLKPL